MSKAESFDHNEAPPLAEQIDLDLTVLEDLVLVSEVLTLEDKERALSVLGHLGLQAARPELIDKIPVPLGEENWTSPYIEPRFNVSTGDRSFLLTRDGLSIMDSTFYECAQEHATLSQQNFAREVVKDAIALKNFADEVETNSAIPEHLKVLVRKSADAFEGNVFFNFRLNDAFMDRLDTLSADEQQELETALSDIGSKYEKIAYKHIQRVGMATVKTAIAEGTIRVGRTRLPEQLVALAQQDLQEKLLRSGKLRAVNSAEALGGQDTVHSRLQAEKFKPEYTTPLVAYTRRVRNKIKEGFEYMNSKDAPIMLQAVGENARFAAGVLGSTFAIATILVLIDEDGVFASDNDGDGLFHGYTDSLKPDKNSDFDSTVLHPALVSTLVEQSTQQPVVENQLATEAAGEDLAVLNAPENFVESTSPSVRIDLNDPRYLPPSDIAFRVVSTSSTERWLPIDTAQYSAVGNRQSEAIIKAVADSNIEHNPRYVSLYGETYCNIFAWDIGRKLGVNVPHWFEGEELTANELFDWFNDINKGGVNGEGYREIAMHEAQSLANDGIPVFAVRKDHNNNGHIMLVYPDTDQTNTEDEIPLVASVGVQNRVGRMDELFPQNFRQFNFFTHSADFEAHEHAEVFMQHLTEMVRNSPEIGGIENYNVPLEEGFGFATNYAGKQGGDEGWVAIPTGIAAGHALHQMVESGAVTLDQLTPGQLRIYELTEGIDLSAPRLEPILQSPEIWDRFNDLLIEDQSAMTPEEALESDKVIGFIATRSADDLGKKYVLYDVPYPEATPRFVGIVMAVDVAARHDWYNNLANLELTYGSWDGLPWLADISPNALEKLYPVNGVLSPTIGDMGPAAALLLSEDRFFELNAVN